MVSTRKGVPVKRFLTAAAAAALLTLLAAAPVGARVTSRGAALSTSDRTFLEDAAGGARYEVLAGQRAVDTSPTPEIVQFGRRMVADHSKEYDDVVAVGRAVGLTVPKEPDHALQRIVAIFSQLSGARFDCAYGPQEYSDHENDIARFTDAAQHSRNGKIRAFALRHLPILRQHRDMIESGLDAIKSC
jgi:putative membrane protein